MDEEINEDGFNEDTLGSELSDDFDPLNDDTIVGDEEEDNTY